MISWKSVSTQVSSGLQTKLYFRLNIKRQRNNTKIVEPLWGSNHRNSILHNSLFTKRYRLSVCNTVSNTVQHLPTYERKVQDERWRAFAFRPFLASQNQPASSPRPKAWGTKPDKPFQSQPLPSHLAPSLPQVRFRVSLLSPMLHLSNNASARAPRKWIRLVIV
jgi:hypothetical protein